MKDRIDHSGLECTNLTEAGFRLDTTMIREDFKIGLDHIMHTEDNQGMANNRGSYRYNTKGSQRYGRLNNTNNRRGNFRSQNYDRNRSRSYERQNRDRSDSRSISKSGSSSGSRATTNRGRIRCFK